MKGKEQITISLPIGLADRARGVGINVSHASSIALTELVEVIEKGKKLK
jgi:hypothetical protein